MTDFQQPFQTIWERYSGEAAWQAVVDLTRYHRIQASPGFRDAAVWLHDELDADDLDVELSTYAADEATYFWTWPSFQEWACVGARLELLTPEPPAGLDPVLADFRACPISLIQRSAPFEGELAVVALEDGVEADDYDGVDVAGKLVLTRGDVRRVYELAVAQRGAAGILFDGMRTVNPVRPEGDLDDVRQYTSFWWDAGDAPCFGFVLTARQGRALRRLLEEPDGGDRRAAPGVRVRARVDSRIYDGEMEVVSAVIPGDPDTEEEVVVVAHLCHPRPSANDNASGAAAALEAARTLHALVAGGQLPRPRRTIRFLWLPEITGSVAYLSRRGAGAPPMVAGLNLDMVGESQEQTGSSWLVERPPDAAASFAPELLAWLRDQMLDLQGMTGVAPSHTGIGSYPLYRQAEVPFSGGSDHLIFSDPDVGVPMPMLIQWPDRFYHTSADTPDRTDPQSLARAGALAAAYAYWLAAAGADEATWLGYQMAARFRARAVAAAREAVTEVMARSEARELASALDDAGRRLAYLLDRQRAALASLERLGPVACLLDDLREEARAVMDRELAWVHSAAGLHAARLGLDAVPEALPHERSAEEQAAAGLVPERQATGPISLREMERRLDTADRAMWRRLTKERKGQHHTLTTLALCWADGERSLLDIADLVELETGVRDVELLLAFFRMLEKVGWSA